MRQKQGSGASKKVGLQVGGERTESPTLTYSCPYFNPFQPGCNPYFLGVQNPTLAIFGLFVALPALQKTLVSFFFEVTCGSGIEKWRGFLVNFLWSWGARQGGRTLRKDVFLPSKHLLSAFYKTLPSKNPSKNLLSTETP